MKDMESIKTLANKIDLPEKAQEVALPLCEKIISLYADKYEEIHSDIGNSALISALAEKMGEACDPVMLAVCLLLGADAYDLYRKRGIDEEVYWSSMRDIMVWTKTCMKMRGHVGLYEYGWIINFLTASIVRLHRLEFHIISFMNNKSWSKNGITVYGGDPVINIHIPEDGPLTHDDVIESYRRAYRYFGCSGTRAFVCNSWLLYPGNYEFLSVNSNIRKFMNDFDIITRHDAKYCGDLWRVFGPCQPFDDTSKFPCKTELQRNMIRYLNEHDYTTGSGYGIFLFDGEKVVK